QPAGGPAHQCGIASGHHAVRSRRARLAARNASGGERGIRRSRRNPHPDGLAAHDDSRGFPPTAARSQTFLSVVAIECKAGKKMAHSYREPAEGGPYNACPTGLNILECGGLFTLSFEGPPLLH